MTVKQIRWNKTLNIIKREVGFKFTFNNIDCDGLLNLKKQK